MSISFCNLTNKKIIVTGASSGLGRTTAAMLSQVGTSVCLIDRDQSGLEATLSLMKSDNHHIVCADLSNFENYNNLFEQIAEKMGRLDGLIHYAGIRKTLPLKAMKIEALQEMLNINLLAFMELVKYFTKKKYINEEGASIVGISSVSSLRGSPALSGYACSKAALEGAMRSLACEFASKKIRINCIAPGFVMTPMNKEVMKALPQDAVDQVIKNHPLGIGTPKDVANLVIFLLSEESRWITGTTMIIDGGFSVRA